jgi:hypothetical protein
MRNITLSIDDDMLNAAREYARKQHTSVNALVRHLLASALQRDSGNSWADQFLQLAAEARGNSGGKRWRREDIYDV